MEDIKIDRAIRSTVYCTTGNNVLIPANPSRVSVTLYCESTAGANLFAVGYTVQGDTAPTPDMMLAQVYNDFNNSIVAGNWVSRPVTLTLRSHGQVLKGPLKLNLLTGLAGYVIDNWLEPGMDKSLDPLKL